MVENFYFRDHYENIAEAITKSTILFFKKFSFGNVMKILSTRT